MEYPSIETETKVRSRSLLDGRKDVHFDKLLNDNMVYAYT